MVVKLWNLVFSSLIHRQRPIWEGWPTKGCLYVAKLRNPCTCTIHIQIFSIAERAKGCMQCRCCSFNHHLSLQSIVISYHICENYTTIYIIILSEHVYIVYIYHTYSNTFHQKMRPGLRTRQVVTPKKHSRLWGRCLRSFCQICGQQAADLRTEPTWDRDGMWMSWMNGHQVIIGQIRDFLNALKSWWCSQKRKLWTFQIVQIANHGIWIRIQ